jgi:hypothetical protein
MRYRPASIWPGTYSLALFPDAGTAPARSAGSAPAAAASASGAGLGAGLVIVTWSDEDSAAPQAPQKRCPPELAAPHDEQITGRDYRTLPTGSRPTIPFSKTPCRTIRAGIRRRRGGARRG